VAITDRKFPSLPAYMQGVTLRRDVRKPHSVDFYKNGKRVETVTIKAAYGSLFCTCRFSQRQYQTRDGESAVHFMQCTHIRLCKKAARYG
jgi:hypothetical protein